MDQEIRTLEVGAELRSLDDNKETKPTTPDTGAEQQSDDKEAKPDVDDSKLHISGYALKFNTPSKDLGGFVEVLDKDSLSDIELDGIKLLNNHDFSQVLASSPETMTLTVDDTGLKFEADLDPEVSFAKDVYQNVKNKNLDKCSFGFATNQDEFIREGEQVVRHIKKINSLFDVSIVAIPAYDDTSVSTRSYTEFIKQNEKVEEDNMTTKVLKNGKDNSEVRNFEAYVRSQGEVRSGLTEDGSHGVLVPTEIITPVYNFKENKSDLAKYATVKKVGTNAGSFPIATNNVSTLNTKAELAELEDVESGINAVDFKVETRAGRIYLSSELVQDSVVNIKSEVEGQLAKMVQNTNNQNIIALMDAKAQAVDATSLDDIKKAYNVSLDPSLDKKVFVSQDGFNWLDTQKDADGRYLLNYNVSEATSASFLGSEVVIIPNNIFPEATEGKVQMFIGDMAQFVALFLRDNVTANWKNFDSYSEGLSVVLRSDYQVIDPEAMVKLSIATTPAPTGNGAAA